MKKKFSSLIPILVFSFLPFGSNAQLQVIGCPGDIESCNPVVTWIEPSITSEIAWTTTSNHKPGDPFPLGTTEVVYEFSNALGFGSCRFNVTVTGTLCNISLVPSNTVFTDGDPSHIYMGYGSQSVTILENSGGVTHTWTNVAGLTGINTNNPVFTPVLPGTYTISGLVTHENGCPKQCSTTICVMDVRAPGNKVYLCKPRGNSGKEVTQSFAANAVANQLQHGSNLGSCGQVICAPASKAVGQEFQEELDLNIYPNPFTNQFNLRLTTSEDALMEIGIYDFSGRSLGKWFGQPSNQDLSFGRDLPPGMYILEVKKDGLAELIKIVKMP